MWASFPQLPLPQERMSTDRSLENSSHYCFSVTASWKPSSPWDLAKGHRWKKLVTAGSAAQQSPSAEFSNGITGYQPAWGGSLDEPGTSPSRHQGMTQTLGNRHNKPHIHSKCINMLWELGKSRSSNRAGSCQMTTLTLLQLAMHQTP